MRRLMLLVLAAAVFTALTSVVTAGGGPRLAGKFNVDATIKGNDFQIPQGTVTKDVYRFKSPCDEGACKTVKLDRKGGSVEHHYKSTLQKDSPGVYKGTEGPYPYDCNVQGAQNPTFKAKHTIEVNESREREGEEDRRQDQRRDRRLPGRKLREVHPEGRARLVRYFERASHPRVDAAEVGVLADRQVIGRLRLSASGCRRPPGRTRACLSPTRRQRGDSS